MWESTILFCVEWSTCFISIQCAVWALDEKWHTWDCRRAAFKPDRIWGYWLKCIRSATGTPVLLFGITPFTNILSSWKSQEHSALCGVRAVFFFFNRNWKLLGCVSSLLMWSYWHIDWEFMLSSLGITCTFSNMCWLTSCFFIGSWKLLGCINSTLCGVTNVLNENIH